MPHVYVISHYVTVLSAAGITDLASRSTVTPFAFYGMLGGHRLRVDVRDEKNEWPKTARLEEHSRSELHSITCPEIAGNAMTTIR